MTANPAKFQILCLGTKEAIPDFPINGIAIPVTKVVKLLGISIDCNLNFNTATQKVSVVRPLV